MTIPIFPIMFLILFTLKITNQIDWSWWWVWAPMYPLPVIFVGYVVMLIWKEAKR